MADLPLDQTHVPDSLYHISGAGFSFGADHRSAFLYSAKCFSQISGTADKGNAKAGLVDMIHVVCGRENFTFINVVDLNSLQDLSFCKMADAAFCHNRNGNSVLNAADHFGVTHTGDSTGGTDISRNLFQSHNGACPGRFCDAGLFRCGHIHDDTALQHLCQFSVEFVTFLIHKFYLLRCSAPGKRSFFTFLSMSIIIMADIIKRFKIIILNKVRVRPE